LFPVASANKSAESMLARPTTSCRTRKQHWLERHNKECLRASHLAAECLMEHQGFDI
jgi:hypothetical protein